MKIFTKLDPSVSSLPQFGKETPYPPQKVHISYIYILSSRSFTLYPTLCPKYLLPEAFLKQTET